LEGVRAEVRLGADAATVNGNRHDRLVLERIRRNGLEVALSAIGRIEAARSRRQKVAGGNERPVETGIVALALTEEGHFAGTGETRDRLPAGECSCPGRIGHHEGRLRSTRAVLSEERVAGAVAHAVED